ncbi:hypothetical protein Ancab_018267 [Ancistrocladus abbreviatus]
MRRQDQQSRVFYELSSLILNILRSPTTTIQFSHYVPPEPSSRRRAVTEAAMPPISPAGFASLLLGISLALMLCGSLTFFVGFMLMPWVLGLVMVFYFVGFVSSLSVLGRSILCYATSSPSFWCSSPPSQRKDVAEINLGMIIRMIEDIADATVMGFLMEASTKMIQFDGQFDHEVEVVPDGNLLLLWQPLVCTKLLETSG